MTAARAGARVLLLESAPFEFRGGNSRHTRNLRYVHDAATDYLTGRYDEAEYWTDLLRVTGGKTDELLARLVIRESRDLHKWIEHHGGRFQPPLRGTLHLARTNAFFFGGGKALMNAYYRTAKTLGVTVLYDAEVTDVRFLDDSNITVDVGTGETARSFQARAAVVASGGYQANISWLAEHWGPAAENFIIRGTPYDTGRVLRVLLDRGVRDVGEPDQCHALAVDARAPKFDGGIVTRLDCIPFGIVVNRESRRFADEGEDIWPRRYAVWGRLIARQPEQTAYCLIDSKVADQFMPSVFPPITANTIEELAQRLELDPYVTARTVAEFNAAVRPGTFDPTSLDDCHTDGIAPAKSHWALPLDTPPFAGYPLRPGITFTYLGVAVNEHAQVIMQDDMPRPNLFAAGEIMAGNILGQGYVGGLGLTLGTVFGRIAGHAAAQYALDNH
jgi:tricarballylate dehydrogenase